MMGSTRQEDDGEGGTLERRMMGSTEQEDDEGSTRQEDNGDLKTFLRQWLGGMVCIVQSSGMERRS